MKVDDHKKSSAVLLRNGILEVLKKSSKDGHCKKMFQLFTFLPTFYKKIIQPLRREDHPVKVLLSYVISSITFFHLGNSLPAYKKLW